MEGERRETRDGREGGEEDGREGRAGRRSDTKWKSAILHEHLY